MTTSQFATITTEGGLLPSDLITRLVADTSSLPGTREGDYHLTPGKRLREVMNRSWNDLLGAWQIFQPQMARLDPDDHTSKLTWDRWLLPLFAELGYGQLQRIPEATVIDGKEYPVSHRHDQALVHLLGWNVPISTRTAGVVGAAKASPHSMVQELLNRSDQHLWAVVSNGRQLRILRDNASLTRAAYVEFDLEQMFTDGVFSDFVALWLLVHASRLEGDPQSQCWLETWAAEAREQGVRALDALGQGFVDAIETLGQGFLNHPANTQLRERLRNGALDQQDYYRQILRIVYRLVFLLVAEDRRLLFPPEATQTARERYTRFYSLSRLRELARRRRGTRHSDLWSQFKVVVAGLGPHGLPALGLPALNSLLWAQDTTPDLNCTHIANVHFLTALRSIAFTRKDQALHRIDYKNLGSEELGSVYESLLELQPNLDPDAATFQLAAVSGNERKTTGSYYTPTALTSALLDISLNHLLDEASASAEPEAAILDLKVIDPACGSGHFLVAAGHRIASRLAAVRTGEGDPPPEVTRHAFREVVGRCLYGIDINPMAVELCKVSLWFEAVEPGKPLSFLDHHIVCGNALLGAYPASLRVGIPDSAYTAVFDDDKRFAKSWRARNHAERAGQGVLQLESDLEAAADAVASASEEVEALGDETVAAIEAKANRFAALQASPEARRAHLTADAWCSAFVSPKGAAYPAVTQATVVRADGDPDDPDEGLLATRSLAVHYHFLHPHLAFPTVLRPADEGMDADPDGGWVGGFHLVLGNPPWDTLSPDRKEFFSAYEPRIRFAKKEEQDAIVAELLRFPEVAERWDRYQRDLFASVHFMKASGRYRLFAPGNLGKGDFNVYRMFVETAMQLTRPGGYVAQVVPAGFYGGANAMAIRKEFYTNWQLSPILGIINAGERWFPGVDSTTRFAAYAARKGGTTECVDLAFQIRTTTELAAAVDGATTSLAVTDIETQSPEALAIPEVTDAGDAALTRRMSARWPAFGSVEGWGPQRHYQAELHMGNDRDLFGEFDVGLPIYEGRMVNQFDHRAKAYRSGRGRAAVWEEIPFGDPRKAIVPQWRILPENIPSKLGDRPRLYRVGWCDVTRPDVERSLLAALIPPGVVCGHSLPTFACVDNQDWVYMPWLAVANSFTIDFLARKKVALHMTFSVLDSLPFPRFEIEDPMVDRLGQLTLRLTCTSPEMTDYWNAMAAHGWCEPVPPGTVPPTALIDPKEREDVRAELDAIVAKHVYGLSAEELSYVMDQFPVLEKRDRKAYGSYVTKERILLAFERA